MSELKTNRVYILAIWIVLVSTGSSARAQRIHDPKKEGQAEQVLKQVEAITSVTLFETQLKNLQTLEGHNLAMVMRNTAVAANSEPASDGV